MSLLYDVALPSGGPETRDLLPLSFWLYLNSPRQCANLPYPAANGVDCCRVPVVPGLVYNMESATDSVGLNSPTSMQPELDCLAKSPQGFPRPFSKASSNVD